MSFLFFFFLAKCVIPPTPGARGPRTSVPPESAPAAQHCARRAPPLPPKCHFKEDSFMPHPKLNTIITSHFIWLTLFVNYHHYLRLPTYLFIIHLLSLNENSMEHDSFCSFLCLMQGKHTTYIPSIKLNTAGKSHQSCPTLCDPIDGSPPGSHPWDSPGKNTGVGCHFLL